MPRDDRPSSCAKHFSIQSLLKPSSFRSVEPVRRRSWTVNGSSGKPSFFARTTTAVVMRLKVVRVDGQPLELSDVLVRHFPQFLTGLLSVVPLLWLLREDSVISFQMIAECQSTPVTLLIGIWGIAQLIVVLSNDRRRAIHDFLAETEVLKLG